MMAGRVLRSSLPRAGSSSTQWMSYRLEVIDAVACRGIPFGPILFRGGHGLRGFFPRKFLPARTSGTKDDFVGLLLRDDRVGDVILAQHFRRQTDAARVADAGHFEHDGFHV